MPHPSEVLPQQKILRDLLRDDEPPPFFDLEQLIRLICSQQLRLERRIEEGMGCIMEELLQTKALKATQDLVCEQGYGQPGPSPDTQLQIKPTPSTQPGVLPDTKGASESQENAIEAVVTTGASSASLCSLPTNLDKQKNSMKSNSSNNQKGNDSYLLVTAASTGQGQKQGARKSMVDHFSTASRKLYDQYVRDQKTTSTLKKVQGLVERLPVGPLRAMLLGCTGLYQSLLNLIKAICEHSAFGMLAASFIVFNAVIMAASVDHLAKNDEEALWMIQCTNVCNVFFIVELAMRLSYQGTTFFTSSEKQWNTFDFSMVALIVMELVTTSSKLNVGQSIKMVKIMRIVRIFRLFKFFEDLSLMVSMIAGSIKSLIWAWILICIIIFSFSIVLTQFTTFYLNEDKDTPEKRAQARLYFGSIPSTVYSLIQAMLSGKSWGEFTDVLLYVDMLSVAIFFFYIALMMIAVMNVITGVFVQDAIMAAGKQRDIMIAAELRAKEQLLENMLDMFTAMDADGSGEINLQEAKDFFRQEIWAAYFSAQGLDVTDAEWIFSILDIDRNGSIPFDEFVEGCYKLKGPAKRTDIAALSQAVYRLSNQVKAMKLSIDPSTPQTNDEKDLISSLFRGHS